MRISILGAGAMGSLFGGLLAAREHHVELLDVNPAHIARVQEHGLNLHTDAGPQTVRIPISRPESASTQPDWLIVFTKTLHTESALEAARALLGPETRVLSLQNGLGNAEKLVRYVQSKRIAVGVTTVPSDMVAPGEVRSHGHGHTRMMMVEGHEDPALAALAETLTEAGLPCSVDPSVEAAIWEKVAFNAALNSICGVTRCTVGQVGRMPAGRELAHTIASEVLTVAQTLGLAVAPDRVHATLDDALDHHGDHQPSMLQDLQAGRPTEIDAINGAVVQAARQLGVATPCTQTLGTLIRLSEAS